MLRTHVLLQSLQNLRFLDIFSRAWSLVWNWLVLFVSLSYLEGGFAAMQIIPCLDPCLGLQFFQNFSLSQDHRMSQIRSQRFKAPQEICICMRGLNRTQACSACLHWEIAGSKLNWAFGQVLHLPIQRREALEPVVWYTRKFNVESRASESVPSWGCREVPYFGLIPR